MFGVWITIPKVKVPLMAKKEDALAFNLDMPSFYVCGDQKGLKEYIVRCRNEACTGFLDIILKFIVQGSLKKQGHSI